MSLRKLLTLFIVLMALGTTSSWASCTRLSSPTVMLDMVVGRVVVPPDLPVGSVILTREWPMSAPGGQAIAVLPAPTALRRRSCRQGPRTLEIKSTPPTCRESACVSAAAAQR